MMTRIVTRRRNPNPFSCKDHKLEVVSPRVVSYTKETNFSLFLIFFNLFFNSVELVKTGLTELAKLHGKYLGKKKPDWLPTRLSGGMYPTFSGIGQALIEYHIIGYCL